MFVRRALSLPKPTVRLCSSESTVQATTDNFRISETNPANFNRTQVGKYFTIEHSNYKRVFNLGGFPKKYDNLLKTFGEACVMVREPALEIIDYIKNTDFNKPTVRYVLYGKDGVGKSLTMATLLHYGAVNDYVLVHIPWVPDWFKKPKEKSNSETKEGFLDINIDAAAWLIHFKSQNAALLGKLGLTCSKDYVWSQRETTPTGASLLELIDHGVNRVKFASGTIEALLAELKLQSTQGKVRTMVAIDGFNAFFHPKTFLKFDNKVTATPDKITITAPFVDITKYDWCNGVCILAVDRLTLTYPKNDSELPRYLLGKEGFEHLDPFVPIRVDNYTDEEFQNAMQYYVNRKWIQEYPPGFDAEIKHLTSCNPYRTMEFVNGL